jgi:taurine dioxygenase
MNTATASGKDRYNDIAIRTAAQIVASRTDAAHSAQSESEDKPVADRFPAFNRTGLGVAVEYERMGNRPVSEALQARAEAFGFELEHLGITIGTVIHNVDLKGGLPNDLIRFLRDALNERKVIFFREQHLSEDEHVAFARCFGELDAFPFGPAGENPFILEIRHNSKRPGSINSWHTDVTWMEEPSLGSIAQCVTAPPVGGDTLFSDSHAAYLGLPKGVREQIQHIHGINDYRNFIADLPTDLAESIKQQIPFGVSHPLARTHPETGKTALYIHGGFLRHESLYDVRTGETMGEDDARALVQLLLQQHNRPEYLCRFRWTEGAMAFWDNRAVQHYAASDYYPHSRCLRRVTVAGDKPYFDEQAAAAEG